MGGQGGRAAAFNYHGRPARVYQRKPPARVAMREQTEGR